MLGLAFPFRVLLLSSRTLHVQKLQVQCKHRTLFLLHDAGGLPHLLTQRWLWPLARPAALSTPSALSPAVSTLYLWRTGQPRARARLV